MALVLETSEFSGGYVLGFQVVDAGQLEGIYEEMTTLFRAFVQQPNFGVECKFEEGDKKIEEVTVPRVEDDIHVVETGYEQTVSAARKRYEVGKKTE
jgi:Bardet-Biedl syndrome 5 protein